MNSLTPAWLVKRFSSSLWRLPLVGLGLLAAWFVPVYMLRGLRGVLLSGALIVGATVVAVGFSHPFPTLLTALFLSFSSLDWILPGPVTRSLLAIVLFRVIYDLLGERHVDLGTTSFRFALALLSVLCVTSILFARRLDLAFVELELLLQGLAYLICISYLANSPERIVRILQAVILGFLVAIALASRALIMSGGLALLGTRYAPRVGVSGWNANVGAVISLCLIPFVAFLMSLTRGLRWVFWLVLGLLMAASVIASASRMGMGVLGLVVLLIAFRFRKLALLLVVAAVVLLMMLPEEYWTRFLAMGQLGGIVVDRSLQLRQHALEASWQLFLSHPWTGIGLGNVYAETGRYMSAPKVAHNTYVGTLASIGIFGFLAYLWCIGSAVQMTLRALRLSMIEGRQLETNLSLMILVSMAGLLVSFTALDLGFHLVFWLLLALANVLRLQLEKGSRWP